MVQIYGKKRSDGQPKALECTDAGDLLFEGNVEMGALPDTETSDLANQTERLSDIKDAAESAQVAIGAKTSAPASVSEDETSLTESDVIALLKALKNLGIDKSAFLGSLDTKIVPVATTPAMDSIIIVAANTEYSKALPANCKAFSFRVVAADKLTAGADVRYAFETGKVDSLTLPFQILDGGAVYSKESLDLSGKTVHVAGGGGAVGHIVLLEWWT